MKIAEFFRVVPRSFKITASTLAACCAGMGIAMMLINTRHLGGGTGLSIAQGITFCLLAAGFVPTWILCLGWVHADARQRGMPAWIWTLVAAFIPNLLGFLLYFACRKPVALPCPHCGQANVPGQRFCSWCGHVASGPLASEGKLA